MLKQHTFLMHNNNNDQLFQLELPMSWNIEKQNLLILFAFCWFFLMLHQYMYYTCSVWHFYLTFQKRNNVSFAHHWAAYSVPGRGLIFLSRRRSFSIMMYFCRTLCHCLNIFFLRDQFSCELTMLPQPFYVFNWFVIHIIVNNKLRIFFRAFRVCPSPYRIFMYGLDPSLIQCVPDGCDDIRCVSRADFFFFYKGENVSEFHV